MDRAESITRNGPRQDRPRAAFAVDPGPLDGAANGLFTEERTHVRSTLKEAGYSP